MAVEIIRVTHKNRGVTKNVCQHLPHWERNNYGNMYCLYHILHNTNDKSWTLFQIAKYAGSTVPFGIR